jgi:hypothetical protein
VFGVEDGTAITPTHPLYFLPFASVNIYANGKTSDFQLVDLVFAVAMIAVFCIVASKLHRVKL